MDERFIKWLNIYDEFNSGTALRDILNDAIRCFRHGIARPALMLSYIAFIQAIRNNLLNSEMPDGFKDKRWQSAMNNLRSDSKWDETVIDCIKMRDKGDDDPAFFQIADTLRDDVCYWRNRRNDCAHYKDSEITLSHVSAFWVFIMDNYNKFTPIGSLQQSINDYNRHFDISRTPRGASTDKIFKRLCLVIKTKEDLEHFLKETDARMNFESQCDLLHNLLVDGLHKEIVICFLKQEKKRLKAYLCTKPKDVSLVLGNDATTTRRFWNEDFLLFANCKNVYVEMLRARMIPDNEIKESLELLLKYEYERGAFYVDDDAINVLMDYGLYDIFIEDYLSKRSVCSDPGEKCRKTDFYIYLIAHGGITDKLILTLSDSVKGPFPYSLKDRLIDDIFSTEANKNKYLQTIARLELEDFLSLKVNENTKK